MADTRAIDVNILVSEVQDDTQTPTLPKPNTPEPNKGKDNSNLSKMAALLLHEAFKYAKQEVTQIASYEVNKYFNLRDDYIGQRNLTVAKNVISKAVGMGTAIAGGFVLGGVVGSAIALIGTTASLGIEIAQNYDQENIKLRQMNAQLEYSRLRAGYSLTSESIGENL